MLWHTLKEIATRRASQAKAKRALDLVGATAGLTALSPLLAIAGVAIWVNMGKPVLFKQQRPGLHGSPFWIHKFRTMTAAKQSADWFRTDSQRLTRLGRFLRRTNIDELPELWNVLKGEMSLVGPRPLLMEYLPKYTPEENRRHEVRPGITGWAQVHGRQTIPFSERLRHDVWYVDNWSVALDMKIMLKTVVDLFRNAGVVSGQDVDDVDDIGLSPDRQRVPSEPQPEVR